MPTLGDSALGTESINTQSASIKLRFGHSDTCCNGNLWKALYMKRRFLINFFSRLHDVPTFAYEKRAMQVTRFMVLAHSGRISVMSWRVTADGVFPKAP